MPDNGEDEMRFSDEKLFQLHRDFNEHVIECEKRFTAGDKQFEQLIDVTSQNTVAMTSLIEETRAVVQLYKDVQGVARVGKGVQTFGFWLLKWPLIGGGLYALFSWVVKHLPDSF